jgi:D-hexose-6-phosphate mutarotase
MDSQAVNARFAIPGEVQFVTRGDNFVVAEVTNALATASIALQGAHLMTWTPRGQEPVIWLSGATKLATGKSIRGGVPICWPWFGPHADAGKPGHGPARTVPWQVVESKTLPDGATRLAFEMVESDAVRALWPHATPVRAVITVGRELTIELFTRNRDQAPITIGEALHTYFQVSDIGKARIEGLAGVTFVDKVENSARKVQQGAVTIGSEVDRVYLGTPGECVIVDEGYGRRIRIAKEGSRSTVVWNPWVEKADKMGDLGENGYRHMLCVENGNALDDVVTIAPGGEHRMAAIYRVEKI